MHDKRDHLGVGFKVWNGQWTWFWSLVHPCSRAGAVGAASSEAEAIREAHAAIEEMTTCSENQAAARAECRFSICN